MIKRDTVNKPKLTDAERHRRFVETARKLEIPDDADLSAGFFNNLVKSRAPKKPITKPQA
jgi:hypothetical protein